MKQRRGEKSAPELMALVLIYSALLLIIIFFTVKAFSPSLAKEEIACRDAIIAHTTLARKMAGLPQSNISSYNLRERFAPRSYAHIPCQPRDITIDNEAGGAARKLVKELNFCWARWQNGDVTLRTGNSNTIVCNPCSTITLENPQKPLTGIHAVLDAKRGKLRKALAVRLPDDYAGTAAVNYPDSINDNAVILFVYARGTDTKRVLQSSLVHATLADNPPGWASLVIIGPNTPEFLTSIGCKETYQGMPSEDIEILD